jgi:catechol 2,3-dioxygenase-like lactoylglutathione lyase family enzyme
MFSHVMLGTDDIERAQRFYDAVLGVLGAAAPVRNVAKTGHVRLFYRHDGASFCLTQPINGEPASCANGFTLGFRCASPEQVRQFHAVALAHGGTAIEEPPGPRGDDPGALHLAYVRDPDGHKLCALHRPG